MKLSREKAQIFIGWLDVVANALLAGAKFWAGISIGSVALLADAFHTLSDSANSIFVVVAAKLASKKPDKEHPFGHGRWELVAALVMAGLLAFIGFEFIMGSIEKLQSRENTEFGIYALIITIVSVFAKEGLAQYKFYLGKKHNNPVITADAWHSRTDAISSVFVLIGIVIVRIFGELWWMDSVLGIICALAIFYAAFQIMKETVTKILGEEPEPKLIDELTAAITELYESDLNMHHIHLHNYVTHQELTLHIRLPGDMSIEKGHDIASEIESVIEERFGMEATIHTEPNRTTQNN